MMTDNELLEKLREYAEWAEANEYAVPIDLSDVLHDAVDEITKLKTQPPRWISVEERLPKDGERVLTISKAMSERVMHYDESRKYWVLRVDSWEQRVFSRGSATHWMPLPEAPEEVK